MKNTILLLFFVVLLLSIRLFFFYSERHIYKENEVFKVTYSLMAEPKESTYGQYFFVGNVMISMPKFPKYRYGDKITIDGKVEKLELERGEILVVKNPVIIKIPNENLILAFTRFVRYRIVESVVSTLPPKEGGLLLGIVLGVRDKIDAGFYEQLKEAGVLHVVAASGQNISITASLLLAIFSKIVKRKWSILFTGACIIFYAALTGFDPPIIRASLMALTAFSASILGRQTSGLYALLFTGSAMIFHNPEMVESISFQLSFLSTLGILLVKPIIDMVVKIKILDLIKEDFTTTIAAQITTLPIILASFGSYSLLTIPINMLVLWTIPFLMIVGIVCGTLTVIHPFLGVPVQLFLFPFLTYFSHIVIFFSQFDFSFSIHRLPFIFEIGYYLILFGVVIKLKQKMGGKI